MNRFWRFRNGACSPRCVLLVAAIVGTALTVGGCKSRQQMPSNRPPVNVVVEPIEPIAELPDTFVIPGLVEPNRVVQVCAEVAGRIMKIYGREGQVVQAGDKIVELNTDLLKAELDRTSSQLRIAQRELERIESLYKRQPPLATESELDLARSNAGVAQAQYDAAEANFKRATISAPINGVLNRLPKEEGEYIQPGVCIAEIVDLDPAVVVVDVPERDVAMLRKGDHAAVYVGATATDNLESPTTAPATVPVASQPRLLEGTLRYISELANPQSLTSRAELTVPNAEGTGLEGQGRALRSGQVVRVRLQRQVVRNAIMVPLGAVLPLEKGYTVWVVENDKAQPRLVRVGLMKDDRILVLPANGERDPVSGYVTGLRSGDRLIVQGQQYVGPGQDVVIRATRDAYSPAIPNGASRGAANSLASDSKANPSPR